MIRLKKAANKVLEEAMDKAEITIDALEELEAALVQIEVEELKGEK